MAPPLHKKVPRYERGIQGDLPVFFLKTAVLNNTEQRSNREICIYENSIHRYGEPQ